MDRCDIFALNHSRSLNLSSGEEEAKVCDNYSERLGELAVTNESRLLTSLTQSIPTLRSFRGSRSGQSHFLHLLELRRHANLCPDPPRYLCITSPFSRGNCLLVTFDLSPRGRNRWRFRGKETRFFKTFLRVGLTFDNFKVENDLERFFFAAKYFFFCFFLFLFLI